MPSHTEDLHAYSAEEFCLAMKAARERQGVTLDRIAEITKIPAYLFAGLEQNDLRRWPNGIFRRSFFRDYAAAIGLPVSDACAAFVRLFPDAEPPAPHTDEAAAEPVKPSLWVLLRQWLTDTRPSHSRSGVRLRIKMPR